MFPEIVASSLFLQNAGLSAHQKSMVLASAGGWGGPSLGNMKRHMRRMLQPCGVDLKQDALIADNDLNVMRSDSTLHDDSNVKVNVGEAQVVKKGRGK